MKKIIFLFILLLFVVQIKAQNIYSVQDAGNSTTGSLAADTLSANEVFPGAWKLVTGYNSVSVSMYSNISSAASGLKVYFGTKLLNGTYKTIDSTSQTYTTGTALNLTVPITAPYLKVNYTNGATVQTYFYLITMLHVGTQGNAPVTVSGGATGGLLTTPYNPKTTVLDSLAHSGGAHVDSAIYHPNSAYVAVYVVVIGRTDKADTISIKTKTTASRNAWSIYGNGLKRMYDGYQVADNQTIIVAANTIERYLLLVPRPEYILVIRKTTNGVNALQTVKVAFEGVNL